MVYRIGLGGKVEVISMIIWKTRVNKTLYRVRWENGGFFPAHCYNLEKGKWTEHGNKLDLEEILHWISNDLDEDILTI